MYRRKAERSATVNDIFSQSDSNFRHAVLRRLVVDGIIIQRTSHSGERWEIKTVHILAYYFLNDDRHLLLVNHIRCSRHICLAFCVENGCIHTFDCAGEQFRHNRLVLYVRNHVGGIHSGKRLVMGVLENTRRPYGQRPVDHFGQGRQIVAHPFRQPRLEKCLQDNIVGSVAQCKRIQVVIGHELIENIGAEHHRTRNTDGNAIETVALRMLFYYRVDECKATAFAAERSLPDAGEVRVVVKTVLAELRHYSPVFHLAILHNQIEKQAFHCRSLLQRIESMVLDHISQREHGAGIQPAGNVVAPCMIQQRLRRDVVHALLQLVDRRHTHDFVARMRILERKISESETLLHCLFKIDRQFFRCLVKKQPVEGTDLLPVFALC